MDAALRTKLVPLISAHEGRSRHMYPDTRGNVTVGVGHLLPSVAAAVALPFYIVPPVLERVRATAQQISAAYAYVKATRQPYLSLVLDDADIDQLLADDIARFEPVVRQAFPEFDNLPAPVQIAIYDMVFNLGSLRAFPKFVAAVNARDWNLAAEECLRRDVGQKRNHDTADLFEQVLIAERRAKSDKSAVLT
jgi:GH24 family phage-related lysozyme (muramidase)